MKKVFVPLANGFEEIETVTIIDALRRAEIEVVVASLDEPQVSGVCGAVTGAHGIAIVPNVSMTDIDGDQFDMIVLPGGLEGAKNLNQDARIMDFIKKSNNDGKFVAAICAAPAVLANVGILNGKKATSYPGVLDQVKIDGMQYVDAPIVIDGNVITSKGPATAMIFALVLIGLLQGDEKRDEVAAALLVRL